MSRGIPRYAQNDTDRLMMSWGTNGNASKLSFLGKTVCGFIEVRWLGKLQGVGEESCYDEPKFALVSSSLFGVRNEIDLRTKERSVSSADFRTVMVGNIMG